MSDKPLDEKYIADFNKVGDEMVEMMRKAEAYPKLVKLLKELIKPPPQLAYLYGVDGKTKCCLCRKWAESKALLTELDEI